MLSRTIRNGNGPFCCRRGLDHVLNVEEAREGAGATRQNSGGDWRRISLRSISRASIGGIIPRGELAPLLIHRIVVCPPHSLSVGHTARGS